MYLFFIYRLSAKNYEFSPICLSYFFPLEFFAYHDGISINNIVNIENI